MSTAAERKAAEKAHNERIAAEEEAAQPQATPIDEPVTGDGKNDKPVELVVSEYPERPYSEAVTQKHREFLADSHPNRLIDLGLAE